MSILSELNSLLDGLGIPIETGVFSGVPPDEYLVITPMTDTFEVFADNRPQAETQEVRLSLFVKGSYTARDPLTPTVHDTSLLTKLPRMFSIPRTVIRVTKNGCPTSDQYTRSA